MTALQDFTGIPEPDPEIESALELVQRPAARPEFKADLQGRFLAAAQASAQISSSSQGSFPLPAAAAGRRRMLLRVGGLLAAGMLIAVGFFFLQSPAPRWSVLDLGAGSIVHADGVPVASEDLTALARTLQHAREIEVSQGRLVLRVGDLSLFDLDAGTRVAFAGFDRGFPGKPYEVRAMSGRLRVRTGPGFDGKRMNVKGDVVDAEVSGTALAIDYEEAGTCVCCLHGQVRVIAKTLGPAPRTLDPEHMCLVHRDSSEPLWGAPPVHHAEPMRALDRRALEIWPPR